MSAPRNPNRVAMTALATELARAGVADACISPGSRSTALVLALAETAEVRSWVATDERSAGFFALGLARERGRPVALVCTSGTAAANYLPAVVEATLSQVPLLLLTADRPPELRDCASPQTIDQVRLFGSHVRWSVDAPAPAASVDLLAYYRTLACRAVAAALEEPRGPVHVNLPMREPLLDVDDERACGVDGRGGNASAVPSRGAWALQRADAGAPVRPFTRVHAASDAPTSAAAEAVAEIVRAGRRGLIVCGPGAATHGGAAAIARLAARAGWPLLADPLSGLRFGGHAGAHLVDAYDVLLRDPDFRRAHGPDAVLQLGAPPVSAALQRFLAAAPPNRHVLVAAPASWPDPLQRATDVVRAGAGALAAAVMELVPAADGDPAWLAAWRDAGAAVRAVLDARLGAPDAPPFEGTVLARLCALLPADSVLHVGNSLPVRALDAFVGGRPAALAVAGNRGASGIDGVLSTALGAAAARTGPTALVLGDLSFLHDVGALQLAARHRLRLLTVVVNNDGGGIFSFLPQAGLDGAFEPFFLTPHGLELGAVVTACGGWHARVTSTDGLGPALAAGLAGGGLSVVEVRVDREASRAAHERLIAEALGRRAATGVAATAAR